MEPHQPMAASEAGVAAGADYRNVVAGEVEREVDVGHGVALDDGHGGHPATHHRHRVPVQAAVERELKHAQRRCGG